MLHEGRDVDDVTRPFHRDTQAATVLARPHEDAPELPTAVAAPLRGLVASMLAREPEDRPSAAEVAERVAAATRPGPVLPPMPPPAATPAPAARWNRHRMLAVVLAGSMGVLALQRRDVPAAGASDGVVPSVVGTQADRATRILRRRGLRHERHDLGDGGPARSDRPDADHSRDHRPRRRAPSDGTREGQAEEQGQARPRPEAGQRQAPLSPPCGGRHDRS